MAALANSRHEALARDVAGGLSESAAWRLAGGKGRNGARVFKRPEVQERVAELREQFNCGASLKLSYLQEQLANYTKGDVADYLEPRPYAGGKLRVKDITKLPPEIRARIAEVTIGRGGEMNFKLHDKAKALESLIRSVQPPASISVSATAAAAAAASAEAPNYSSADLARRVSWLIEEAAAETGETGDDAPPLGDPDPPPKLPPPKERAKVAMKDIVSVARELRGDAGALQWLADKLAQASNVVREMVPAA